MAAGRVWERDLFRANPWIHHRLDESRNVACADYNGFGNVSLLAYNGVVHAEELGGKNVAQQQNISGRSYDRLDLFWRLTACYL